MIPDSRVRREIFYNRSKVRYFGRSHVHQQRIEQYRKTLKITRDLLLFRSHYHVELPQFLLYAHFRN